MHKLKKLNITELYGKTAKWQLTRIQTAIEEYRRIFYNDNGDKITDKIRVFSVPGQTEIVGDLTEQNKGKVVARTVDVDIIAVAEPTDNNKIIIYSKDFAKREVNLENLKSTEIVEKEKEQETWTALIRGVAGGFKGKGRKIGGFNAYMTSDIPSGFGLSSSSAFAVMIGTIFSHLYNEGVMSGMIIAETAKYAESLSPGKNRNFAAKIACAFGGCLSVDFKDEQTPLVERVNADFSGFNHTLCLINLNNIKDIYSGKTPVPEQDDVFSETRRISEYFDVDCLRKIEKQDIILNIKVLRDRFGDRAVLRALHFFTENERVDLIIKSLINKDFEKFLFYINENGNSSCKYLQNVPDIKNRKIFTGLMLTENALQHKGACRINNCGLSETIQAFVPDILLKMFRLELEQSLGVGSVKILNLRDKGAAEIIIK